MLGDNDENLIGTRGLGIGYPEDEAFALLFPINSAETMDLYISNIAATLCDIGTVSLSICVFWSYLEGVRSYSGGVAPPYRA